MPILSNPVRLSGEPPVPAKEVEPLGAMVEPKGPLTTSHCVAFPPVEVNGMDTELAPPAAIIECVVAVIPVCEV